MAFFSRLSSSHPSLLLRRRRFSILSSDSSTSLSAHQKTRAALSLLKSEQDPNRILDICRAASLTPVIHLDRIAFSIAVNRLSRSNNHHSVHLLLQDLRARPDLKNERFASHSLILYGQAKMLDRAVAAFDEFYNEGLCRSAKSLNALLHAGVIAKEHREVNRIFLEFPKRYGIEPDLDTYNMVIKSFSESGSTSSAYSLLAEMERKGLRPNSTTFSTIIGGFYAEEKYEDVGKVIKMMEEEGIPRGISIYNTRIKSLCKIGKTAEAKALFEAVLSRGMKPNTVTYYQLIYGLGKDGNLEEAVRLFKSMASRGCQPDGDCYLTLLYYLCQGGDFETAHGICKESMEKNWFPKFTTMKMLVNGLAGMSKVEEARELVGKLKEKFSNSVDKWEEIEKSLPQ